MTKIALTRGGNPRYSPKFTVGSRRSPYRFPLSPSRRIPPLTRRLYSRDHILRFNLSIVPGITEFRRKNNAYCGTHKAVAHKTPMSSRMNSGAQARTTCIFMPATGSAHRFFLSRSRESGRERKRADPRCRTSCDIARLPAACNRQYQLKPP